MENQSLTPERLAENKRIEQKEKFFAGVKDNLNYIYIFLMIIANCIISLLKIEDGQVGIKYPSDGLGWALWITQVLVITFLGVMILNTFRRQGIKNGHKTIKETYEEYLKAIANFKEEVNPRSERQYMKQQTLRDTFSKGSILIIVNLLVISAAISLNPNAILALFVNILLSVCFGIKAMLDAEDFVIKELVVWYKIKIRELTTPKEKKNERKISRNRQSGTRSSITSGV